MKLITTMPYNKVRFRWVSNHWDLHLSGLCTYNGSICYFNTPDGGDEFVCEIYKLSLKEKCRWLYRQKKFELMVGHHWTYPYRATGERPFHYRKPQWLYKRLFRLFYRIRKPMT